MWAGFWLGVVIYAAAWLQGGRVERFAAMVMIVQCMVMVMNFILTWDVGGVYLTAKVANAVCLAIFGWLCLRSDRWWLFLMVAGTGLQTLVDVVALLDPGISQWGAASAKIGLGYLCDLSLLLGVYERWLAGEPPAGQAAWARAGVATAARRNRKTQAQPRRAMPLPEPAKVGAA